MTEYEFSVKQTKLRNLEARVPDIRRRITKSRHEKERVLYEKNLKKTEKRIKRLKKETQKIRKNNQKVSDQPFFTLKFSFIKLAIISFLILILILFLLHFFGVVDMRLVLSKYINSYRPSDPSDSPYPPNIKLEE